MASKKVVAKTDGGAKITKKDITGATGGSSEYSSSELAAQAAAALTSALNIPTNNLDEYVTAQLRGDFVRDRAEIQGLMDAAANSASDLERAKMLQEANRVENANFANTQNAIAQMKAQLAGSAASGANQGAANATALQALLGLGQTNADATTGAMQNVANVERERASKLAQNAVDAINTANEATKSMYDVATSAYGADKSALGYRAQGAAQGLGEVGAASDTNASQERQNNATNATNASIANAQNATQVAAAKQTQKSKNTNINKNKK